MGAPARPPPRRRPDLAPAIWKHPVLPQVARLNWVEWPKEHSSALSTGESRMLAVAGAGRSRGIEVA